MPELSEIKRRELMQWYKKSLMDEFNLILQYERVTPEENRSRKDYDRWKVEYLKNAKVCMKKGRMLNPKTNKCE